MTNRYTLRVRGASIAIDGEALQYILPHVMRMPSNAYAIRRGMYRAVMHRLDILHDLRAKRAREALAREVESI